MVVLIDGKPAADPSISIFDAGLVRGDGCFEVLRSYDGRAFAVGEHLNRLERSSKMLGIDLPPRSALADWIAGVAAEGGDGLVRLMATRGGADRAQHPARVIVNWEPMPDIPDEMRLLPTVAPWHAAGADWSLAGAKTLSYAPNMSAIRDAQNAGYDDALLLATDGTVLEGPTFSIAWVTGGRLVTPTLELSILESVTRRVTLQLAGAAQIEVEEGSYRLEDVLAAPEAMVLSTVKEVAPVAAIGDHAYQAGPVTASLAELFAAEVHSRLR